MVKLVSKEQKGAHINKITQLRFLTFTSPSYGFKNYFLGGEGVDEFMLAGISII